MSKESELNQLDKYREVLTETRLKVLSNLEKCIKAQSLDSTEALDKLAAVLLLPRTSALAYARALGSAELWKRAE